MSYILDALKKIEHEKSKKANPAGRISISADLFNERKRPKSSAARWKIVVLIVAASLVTCAGTWFVLRSGNKKIPVVAGSVPSVPALPISPSAMPVPAPVPVQAPPAPAAVPAVPVTAVPVIPERTVPKAAAPVAQRSKKSPKSQPPAILLKQTVQTVQAPADIKLSGIAWQEERAARRAVVNGFLLKEGAVISGAKITDIKSDGVRFSSAAGVFEIKLNSVVPGDVQK